MTGYAVAALRLADTVQVGRVTVDQLVPLERVVGQEPVAAAVNQLHLMVATKRPDGPGVEVDADRAQRRRLALHDRTPTKMRLDIGGMRRHEAHNRLAEPRRRFRTIPCAHGTAFPEPSRTSHRTSVLWCQTESSSPRHDSHDDHLKAIHGQINAPEPATSGRSRRNCHAKRKSPKIGASSYLLTNKCICHCIHWHVRLL